MMDTTVSDYRYHICVSVLSGIVITWDIVSLAAILKTKRTPKIPRFLTCGLISLETVGLISFDVLLYISHLNEARLLRFHIITLGVLIYTTILLMAIERFTLLTANNVFHNNGKREELFTRITLCLWSLEVIFMFILRFLVCRDTYPCAKHLNWAARITMTVFLLTADILGVLIFTQLRTSVNVLQGPMLRAKATVTTFVYMAIYTIFSALLALGFIFSFAEQFEYTYILLGVIVCVLDPVIYVFWYKESKMQLLFFFRICHPKIAVAAERMRFKIFDIVAYSQHPN